MLITLTCSGQFHYILLEHRVLYYDVSVNFEHGRLSFVFDLQMAFGIRLSNRLTFFRSSSLQMKIEFSKLENNNDQVDNQVEDVAL